MSVNKVLLKYSSAHHFIYTQSLAVFATTANLSGFNTKPKIFIIKSLTGKVNQVPFSTMTSQIACVHPVLLTPKVLVSLCHYFLI